ncbi:MAG: choice-of-anchor J domain-containing protein [Candidatus Cloacimonetes bacterium]|nr:choice-of-anchor J domain-containing protein [Candidatus Cloacimonadota bacterium]MCB5287376.1 choice-of-anchor J domain-containing protein [Candidatus Cloacimonadota bacterium]MCK9184177.1 choice-of-anchor J domain-containing protein [Candidatus Cloacimonadota bacterium]MDY0229698.1 choice-of-anchor J domain-containing protein [Candidatus Cloacimonadaceae bacterium]
MTIKLGHSTQSELDYTFVTGLTQVWSANPYTPATGWNTHVFDTPFLWNGVDNLVVEVFYGDTTAGYSNNASVYYSMATNMTTYFVSDNTDASTNPTGTVSSNRANMKFDMAAFVPTIPPNPALLVSPANAAINAALSTSLNWANGGGVPTGFKLFFGTDNPPTNIVNNADLGDVFTYNPGPLTRGETYYWQVVPYNTIGDNTDCPVWSFSTIPEGFVMIGDGTVTNTYLPLNPAVNYNYSQTLYLQSEIDISGQRIEKLYYNWNGTSIGTNCKDWTIYMGHTNKTVFASTTDWIPVGNLSPVFSGELTLPASAGWVEIVLTAPFVYNNSDNLVIAVNETTTGTASGRFLGTSMSGINRGLRVQRTSTVPCDPTAPGNGTRVYGIGNIRMQFGEIPSVPAIYVTPDAWDFDTQIINTVSSKEFTISNTGGAPLLISSLNVSGTGFALAEAFAAVTVPANEGISFTVNYAPVVAGNHTGMISISSNADPVEISLSGNCVDPTISSFPHTQDFDDATVPDLPLGWSSLNVDDDTAFWASYATNPNSAPNCASIGYNYSLALNDWLVSPAIELEAGTVYALEFKYRGGGTSYAEKLEVMLGTGTQPADFSSQVFVDDAIDFISYTDALASFTVPSTGTYYLGWHAYSPANLLRIYVDDITIRIPDPMPPEPATAVFPLNDSSSLVNPVLQWAPSTTGETAMSYEVYMNETGFFTGEEPVYEGTALQYQTTGLIKGRSYYWKVLPINAFGSDAACPTWTFNTPGEEQLAEGFEATSFPPLGWANTGTWNRNTTVPLFEGAAHASRYTSTTTEYVLSTPMLSIGEGSSTIEFYTRASTTAQLLQVVYSEDRTNWNPIGDEISYAAINIWYPISIDLSDISGASYYLGIQTAIQTASGTIYVDHVIGPNIAPVTPGVPTLTAPANAATNQSGFPKLTWAAEPTGGIPTGYNIYLDQNADPISLIGASSTTSYEVNTPLVWGGTYYWKVVATNDAGPGLASAVRSFTVMDDPTIYALPYTVDFGISSSQAFPPLKWTQLNGFYPTPTGTTAQWFRDEWLNGPTGNNAAKINIWGSTRNGWLVTPPIAIPADGHELRFDLGLTKCNNNIAIDDPTAQEDDRFIVLVSDTPNMSNATILQEWNNSGSEHVFNAIPHTGTGVIIDLTGHSGEKYIAFYGESTVTGNGDNDLFVDNVMVRLTPVGRPDPVTLVSPADEATLLPVEGFSLSWAPVLTGGNPSSYKVYLDTNENPETLIATELAPAHEVVGPLALGSTYYWKVIASNIDGDAAASAIFSFQTMPEGLVVLGDGMANNSLPVNAYYGYTYSQSIYPQASLNMADKRIEKISYYWNGAGVGTNTSDWIVYMGHSSASEFVNTSAWIPLAELTEVYTGNVSIPATAGWIEITLQTPFIYNNSDNLVIAVDENTSGYDGSGRYFYTTSAPASVSLRIQDDYTNPDPTSPPDGTRVSAYPNIMLQFLDIPMGAPDPVTLISPADEATDLPLDGFQLTWTPALTGGYAEYYMVYMSQNADDPTDSHFWDLIADTSFDPTRAETNPLTYSYGETWYWTVMACNGEGEILAETAFSFTIMDDPRITQLPYSENFDAVIAPDLPTDWTGYVSASNNYASITSYESSTYAVSQPNSIQLTNNNDSNADLRLITPEITVPLNTIKLSFSARGGAGYTLLVGTVDAVDGSGTFTQLASFNLTSTHIVYSVPFGNYSGSDTYICFKHGLGGTYRSIYIDNVQMDALVPKDLAMVSLTGPDYAFENTAVTHTVTVKNNGTMAQDSYTVYLKSVDNRDVLASAIISQELLPDATKAVQLTWTPAAPAALQIYAEVVLADDEVPVNNVSENMSFNIYEEGILFEGFEAGAIPANWTVINADGGTQVWNAQTNNYHTGSYSARVRYESDTLNNDDWLITPPLQVTSATTDNISFWMRSYDATNADPWQVLISTTDTNPASFAMIDDGTGQMDAYVQKSYNLDSYGDAVIYLAVRYMGAYNWYLYVDDFVGPPIYSPASLDQPVVTITSSGTNVDLTWDLIPNANTYQIHAADAPEGPYTLLATQTGNTYSSPATSKKFFKVVASTESSRTIVPQALSLEQQLRQDEADRASRGKN